MEPYVRKSDLYLVVFHSVDSQNTGKTENLLLAVTGDRGRNTP